MKNLTKKEMIQQRVRARQERLMNLYKKCQKEDPKKAEAMFSVWGIK